MNLDNLKAQAALLTGEEQVNASDLLERMESVIEGIGDTPSTWRPGLLKLLQPTSDRSNLPKGSGAGDLFLGETKQEQPLKVIPLRTWNGRQYWSPDQNEAKMLCSSPDAQLGYIGEQCRTCQFSKFDEVSRKSACSKIKQFMVIKADLSDIFIINFSKTNYAVGNEWETLMKKAGVVPYRRVYALSSETNKKYKTTESYVVETLTGTEKSVKPELIPFLEALFDVVKEERKQSLDRFYEIVQQRKEQAPMLGNDGADADVPLLNNETAGSEETSSLASKYAV